MASFPGSIALYIEQHVYIHVYVYTMYIHSNTVHAFGILIIGRVPQRSPHSMIESPGKEASHTTPHHSHSITRRAVEKG